MTYQNNNKTNSKTKKHINVREDVEKLEPVLGVGMQSEIAIMGSRAETGGMDQW